MSKVDVEFKDDKFLVVADPNEDGEPVAKVKVAVGEAIQEAFKRGDAVEGAKIVEFSFQLTKLVLKLDTDKDGEHALELEIDLAEALDELNLIKA